jgi:hypothetical protein
MRGYADAADIARQLAPTRCAAALRRRSGHVDLAPAAALSGLRGGSAHVAADARRTFPQGLLRQGSSAARRPGS